MFLHVKDSREPGRFPAKENQRAGFSFEGSSGDRFAANGLKGRDPAAKLVVINEGGFPVLAGGQLFFLDGFDYPQRTLS